MAESSNLGEQLAGMMNAIKYYSDSRPPTQNSDLSIMTLLWPLLPLMPPEPPTSILELLKEPEKCDVCGIAEKRPLLKRNKSATGVVTDNALRLRFSDKKTPLEKLMREIEEKMDDTLNSIETTTKHTDELKSHTKELTSGKNDLTDDEMMRRLNSLVNEKTVRERRVKALEIKEKELKESLMTAIKWAKGIEVGAKEQHNKTPDNSDLNESTDLINQPIERLS